MNEMKKTYTYCGGVVEAMFVLCAKFATGLQKMPGQRYT